ncbi:hypothetical protein FOZ60_015312 [Perkinsus olseni]|nr:hypothetical protein FOZ60_015312 [Perkinsus olseni]
MDYTDDRIGHFSVGDLGFLDPSVPHTNDMISWIKHLRYENPAGGDIIFHKYHLCWGHPCVSDPSAAASLDMEWMRRGVPIGPPFRPTPEAPRAPEMPSIGPYEHIIGKPLQEYTVHPYDINSHKLGGPMCLSKGLVVGAPPTQEAETPAHLLRMLVFMSEAWRSWRSRSLL